MIAWVLIPDDTGAASAAPTPAAPTPAAPTPAAPTPAAPGLLARYLGVALILAGGVLILRLLAPWPVPGLIWPLLVIAAGVLVLISAARGRRP